MDREIGSEGWEGSVVEALLRMVIFMTKFIVDGGTKLG